MKTRYFRSLAILLMCAMPSMRSLSGATFIVPPDREMVRQATAIVVASPIASHTQLRHETMVETVTTMSIEEVLKGAINDATIEIHEPGGTFGKRTTSIPGIPRFADGERYVLFLMKTDEGIWRVLNLVLGKFRFDTDVLGHDVVMRDSQDIAAWDPDGKPHRETNRAADGFVEFIRAAAKGGPAKQDYSIPAEPLLGAFNANVARKVRLRPTPLCVFPCTPSSYSYFYIAPNGARWTAFPVTFFHTGANSAAITAMNNAIASWNNDANSNVTYINGGADGSGMHTGGVSNPDGQNTVAFERDLAAEFGAPPVTPFSCGGSSYGGTLGIGAITNDSGTHIGPNGETFYTSAEADVEMNQGLSTCAFFIGLGDFNSAVAHELGHTLGFRHSDQGRDLYPGPPSACSADMTLECTSSAIMNHQVPSGINGALQAWDQHAVDTIYPNPAIAAPTGVEAHATTSTNIRVTWTTVTGATSYHVYRSADNVTFTQVSPADPGAPMAPPYNDTVSSGKAYLYKVRAFNGSSESADSNKDLATAVVPSRTLVPQVTTIAAVDFNELRAGVNAVQTLAGAATSAYTDPTLNNTVTVKKQHVDELLTRLNSARATLGFGGISLSGGAITQFVTPVRASDVNDVRAGFF